MKTNRLSRLLLAGLLLCVLLGLLTWQAIRHADRQRRMDRQLIHAILNYDTDRAIALLRQGADPNAHETPDPPLPFRQQVWNRLTGRKLPVNESDTALLLVMDSLIERPKKALDEIDIPRENAALVTALLDHGAGINAVNEIHDTPLLQATSWSYTATVRILLAHGADPNIAPDGGDTALMDAATHGNSEVVRMLLEKGADPNARDILSGTALMDAAHIKPQEASVALLLKYHAKLDYKNYKGQTALAIARQWKEKNIIRMLQQAGAKQ